jgi:hypothetical protein
LKKLNIASCAINIYITHYGFIFNSKKAFRQYKKTLPKKYLRPIAYGAMDWTLAGCLTKTLCRSVPPKKRLVIPSSGIEYTKFRNKLTYHFFKSPEQQGISAEC